ncbi:MAG: dihydrolipoamide acetyltransferase family protein, partial [Terriglobales bacterium]
QVQRDEPLFEISTDKVDAEIPAPASGVLKEIKVQEGATVQVNTVVGVIDADGAGAAAPAPAKAEAAARPAAPAAKAPEPPAAAPSRAAVVEMPEREEGERVRSSPLVRKIAAEHHVDLGQVPGTGLEGRITKQDIMSFIEQQGAGGTVAAATSSRAAAAPAVAPAAPARPAAAPVGGPAPGEIVPMSTMRKKIAEHMVASRRTSAHVHCVYEVDMTRIVRLREKEKKNFEQRTGAKLTYMPFFARAVINGMRLFPVINSSIEGENIHYKREINLGIAVALDWGLIVPVVKRAEERNFLGLQRAISDVGERARSKKLTPDDVQGSTFTITNPGQFGALFGLPSINQPNVAIMGVGGIFKAPMVVTDDAGQDSIAIRSVVHLVLGYDHRIIDGAVADQFMAQVKK